MSKILEIEPVLPPGDTLEEVLEDRGWTQKDLAERLGVSPKHVNEIIQGKAPISHKLAHDLELVLGITATFWNNYESAYRAYLTRVEANSRLASEIALLEKLPWKKAVNATWIEKANSMDDQLRIVLAFFRVASLEKYFEIYQSPAVAFKKHHRYQSDPDALAFWLRRGQQIGENSDTSEFDGHAFSSTLSDIRGLTFESDPDVFVPRLTKMCAECGVAVAFVPELAGTCVFGATRWLSPTKALIQLSLRRKSNDFLWFTFFHESAHILKHGKRAIFVEGGQDDELEREADSFAQETLIPSSNLSAFLSSGGFSIHKKPNLAEINYFAEEIGIAPGIVVGRLQRERVLSNSDFNSKNGPKVYFEWKA